MQTGTIFVTACYSWMVWGATAAMSQTVDLTRIERTLRSEPAYQSKNPKYALLVFGLEAKFRVWLVLDGDVMYVDRTGTGDLTDGKRLNIPMFTERGGWKTFQVDAPSQADGKTKQSVMVLCFSS